MASVDPSGPGAVRPATRGGVIDGGPEVRLRNWFERPYDDAIAAARTCYSPRVIEADEITERQRRSIGPLTFEGGHHTVYQHATFEFSLSGISRQLVWCFLHAFPFYNTEQQSQRYVRLDEARAHVPPALGGEARARLRGGDRARLARLPRAHRAARARDARRSSRDLWRLDRRASRRPSGSNVAREAEKKAIETARYVIPIACHTAMVYTVSGLVLHRLRRMAARLRRARGGARRGRAHGRRGRAARSGLLQRGRRAAARRRGDARERARAAPASATPRRSRPSTSRSAGRSSRLVDCGARAPAVVADAVRHVLGRADLDDDEALALALDPAQQPLPARDAQRLDPRAADAHARARPLHVPQEALAHAPTRRTSATAWCRARGRCSRAPCPRASTWWSPS